MYDPTIGRWTSRDPLGFEADDPNLMRYVGNNPTNLTDPSGLEVPKVTIEPVSKAKGGKYGAFVWPIKWKLDKEACEKGGMILQKVEISHGVKFKSGPFKDTPFAIPQLQGVDLVWWEAWPIEAGQKETNLLSHPGDKVKALYERDGVKEFPKEKGDDWFFMYAAGRDKKGGATKDLKNTYGWIKFTAQVYYYDGLTEEHLKDFGFKRESVFTGAGALYSYRLGPKGNDKAVQMFLAKFKDFSGPVAHELRASWDPDKDDGETKVETKP